MENLLFLQTSRSLSKISYRRSSFCSLNSILGHRFAANYLGIWSKFEGVTRVLERNRAGSFICFHSFPADDSIRPSIKSCPVCRKKEDNEGLGNWAKRTYAEFRQLMEIYYGYTVALGAAAAPEKDFHAGRVSFLLPLLLLQQYIVTPHAEFTTIGQVDGLW